jgi:hypothetical protein
MRCALQTVIAWASDYPLEQHVRLEPITIATASRYQKAPMPAITFQRKTGERAEVTLEGKYTPEQAPTHFVTPPLAYAIPESLHELHELLARHALTASPPHPLSSYRVEETFIDTLMTSSRSHRPPRKL